MKKLILLLVLMIPLAAFARFEKLVTDVNDMFGKISGYVVSAEGESVYTDLGRDKGAYKGMVAKVYRENEPIIHPITGQILGNKKIYVGDMVLDDVQEKFSTGRLTVQQRAPKQGDIVVVNPPIDVMIKVQDIPSRLEVLLKEEISKANNIMIKDKARLAVTFSQKAEGGIGYTVTDTQSGAVIYSKYFSDLDTEAGKSMNAARDILTSKPIDKPYKSMAVGRVKKDDQIYLTLATSRDVDFYTFDGKQFTPAGSLGAKLRYIQNVETADLNGNGIDEIFITTVLGDSAIKSSVYEFDGKKYVELANNIPYILRTIYVNGQKKIVSQMMGQDGEYLGNITEIVCNDGKYERGQALNTAGKASIYGFGYGDLNKDGSYEVLDINSDYKVDVYNKGARLYTSIEQFGQTPYYFLMKQEIASDFRTTEEGDDPFIAESKRRYIKGRVFVNSDGNVYLVKNDEKYKMLSRTKIYGSSSFTIFSWDGRRLRQQWESDIMQPTIVDYFMYEEFGRTYLFMLRNYSENMFKDDKSQIIYIETK
ncbi:MAG: hypothetical protein AB7E96_11920 [Deferribacterales bacterium]